MTRQMLTLIFVLGIFAGGCVPRSELQAAQVQCRADLAAAGDRLAEARSECQQESEKWRRAIEAARDFTDAEFVDLETEFERIRIEVPDEARQQVEESLTQISVLVHQRFDKMERKLGDLGAVLEDNRGELDAANRALESLRAQLDNVTREARDDRRQLRSLATDCDALISDIQEFDHKHFNCKTCPEDLSIRRARSNVIETFHDRLSQGISHLKTRLISEPEAAEGPSGSPAQDP